MSLAALSPEIVHILLRHLVARRPECVRGFCDSSGRDVDILSDPNLGGGVHFSTTSEDGYLVQCKG